MDTQEICVVPNRISILYQRIFTSIEKYATYILCVAVGIFILYFSRISIVDHLGFRTSINDLGHMEQSIWQITKGNFSMPISHPEYGSGLRMHSFIIFYVIAPFYALFPNPIFLLLLSVLSAAAGAFGLYLLASSVLGCRIIGLVFGVALLLNPQVQDAVLFDFHPEVLAIPLLIFSLYFAEKHRWKYYWICAALLMTVKEDMPLLLLFCCPLLAVHGARKQAIFTAIMAVTYFLGINWITEMLTGEPVAKILLWRFRSFGNTLPEIVIHLITHPGSAFPKLTEPPSIIYIKYMFLQGGILAMWNPAAALIALPNIAQNTLASKYQMLTFGVYYSGIVISAIYVGVVYALKTIRARSKAIFTIGLLYFVLQSLTVSYEMSLAPYGKITNWEDYKITVNRNSFKEIASYIPEDAALSTQMSLGTHFAKRDVLLEYPVHNEDAEYILFMAQRPYYRKVSKFLHSSDMFSFGKSKGTYEKIIPKAFRDTAFGVVAYKSPFYLLKRGVSHEKNPAALQALERDLQLLDYDEKTGINKRILRSIGR